MNDLDELVSLRDALPEPPMGELILRCRTDVAAVRRATPPAAQHRVELLPGDICARGEPLGTLQTSELTAHTLAGIADRPIMVGSVFQLRFDRTSLDVPPTLAVCERCAMLSETSFELRLRFATPVDPAEPSA